MRGTAVGRPAVVCGGRLLGDEFEIKLLLNQRLRVRRRAEWRVWGVGRRVRGRPGQITHAAAPSVNYTRPAACVGPPGVEELTAGGGGETRISILSSSTSRSLGQSCGRSSTRRDK